jgi:hypothetical protein
MPLLRNPCALWVTFFGLFSGANPQLHAPPVPSPFGSPNWQKGLAQTLQIKVEVWHLALANFSAFLHCPGNPSNSESITGWISQHGLQQKCHPFEACLVSAKGARLLWALTAQPAAALGLVPSLVVGGNHRLSGRFKSHKPRQPRSHVGTHQSLTAKTSISNVRGMGLLQLLLHVLQKPHCVHQPSTSLIPAPGGEKLEWALPRAKWGLILDRSDSADQRQKLLSGYVTLSCQRATQVFVITAKIEMRVENRSSHLNIWQTLLLQKP